jgi:flagellar assembly protein FliH
VANSRSDAAAGDDSDTADLKRRISELQAEAASREARARQEGISEAQAATEQRLAAPLEQAAARWANQVAELTGLRKKLRREAEEDLVRLAVAIARRILRRELTADPGAILGIVKAALDRVDAREVFRIRVHPDDAPLIRSSLQARNLPDKAEVVAESGLERGGVIVETSRGNLDAAIESQLKEIERGLTDLARRSAG